MTKKIGCSLLFTLVMSSFLLGQKVTRDSPEYFGVDTNKGLPQGLSEGQGAPDFNATDQEGKPFVLKDKLKSGPVVLLFFRGYWCPADNQHLSQFQSTIDILTEKGATVVGITPQEDEGMQKSIDINKLQFPIISDTGYEIMNNYGVTFEVTSDYVNLVKDMLKADIPIINGDVESFLPVPATYVISSNGKIKKKFFEINYNKRPDVEQIARYL